MAQAAGRQSLSSRGLQFDPGQFQMILVTDEGTPERLSVRALSFPPVSVIPPLLHTDLHLLLILPDEQTSQQRTGKYFCLFPSTEGQYTNTHNSFIALYKHVPFHIVTCRSSGFTVTWIWIGILLCDIGTHVPDYTVSEFRKKKQWESSLCVCVCVFFVHAHVSYEPCAVHKVQILLNWTVTFDCQGIIITVP